MYLKHYNVKLIDIVMNFELLEADLKFTKSPLENIYSAQKNSDRHPTLVMNNGVCVAFFTLHEGEGTKSYTDNPNAIFFRSFSVDQRFRGQGIGKHVIELLPQYIDEIVLTVNIDNQKAINLYKQAGYHHTHDSELLGRPVYVMSKKIKK